MAARDLAQATPRRLTRAEYDRMIALGFFRDERLELVHGLVLRMSPTGPDHASVVDRLMELFVPLVAGRARVRMTKGALYAAAGVPENWIIDVAGRAIEVYTSPDGARYASVRRVPAGESASPAAFGDVAVGALDLLA
jgi:Uma2 family endonuclease